MSGRVTLFPRKMYYISLKGPNAGLPFENPEGESIAAMGGKISREEYPEACRVLERVLGQQRFIVKRRGKVRSWLVDKWNGFLTEHTAQHPWLLHLYRDRMMQNPDWHPEYLRAPDAGKLDILTLSLRLATRKSFEINLEPRGMDFD